MWSALLGELRGLGHVEGRTVAFDRWSWSGFTSEQREKLAYQVVATDPDVVVVTGAPTIIHFSAATSAIPIVGIGTSPAEFHANLARPGGNITGFDLTGGGAIYGKAVQYLRDAVPTISRVAVVTPRAGWDNPAVGGHIRAAAVTLQLSLVPVILDRPIDEAGIRAAFATISGQEFDACYITPNSAVVLHKRTVVELVRKTRLPAISITRVLTEAGLLMSFDTDRVDLSRKAAGYVDKILKGALPGDLPIQQPTVYDFVINLATSRALGITFPNKILYAATGVIE